MFDVEKLSLEIAQKLTVIKDAETEKLIIQKELDSLNRKVDDLTDRLNKLDSTITSTKYEITHRMTGPTSSILNVIK